MTTAAGLQDKCPSTAVRAYRQRPAKAPEPYRLTQSPGLLGGDSSKEVPAPFAAVGVLYKFDDRWYTKLELEHYQNVAYDSSNGTNTANVNAGTVGIGFRF
jgi:hypothetical protein